MHAHAQGSINHTMQNITGFLPIIENIEKKKMIYCSTGRIVQ